MREGRLDLEWQHWEGLSEAAAEPQHTQTQTHTRTQTHTSLYFCQDIYRLNVQEHTHTDQVWNLKILDAGRGEKNRIKMMHFSLCARGHSTTDTCESFKLSVWEMNPTYIYAFFSSGFTVSYQPLGHVGGMFVCFCRVSLTELTNIHHFEYLPLFLLSEELKSPLLSSQLLPFYASFPCC